VWLLPAITSMQGHVLSLIRLCRGNDPTGPVSKPQPRNTVQALCQRHLDSEVFPLPVLLKCTCHVIKK